MNRLNEEYDNQYFTKRVADTPVGRVTITTGDEFPTPEKLRAPFINEFAIGCLLARSLNRGSPYLKMDSADQIPRMIADVANGTAPANKPPIAEILRQIKEIQSHLLPE